MSRPASRILYPILLLLLLAAVVASRWITREQYISGIDPANYVLAIEDYSIADERPHAPGYPVYVAMLRGLTQAVDDPHTAMLVLQIVFSVMAVILLYLLASQLISRRGAFISSLFLASNPLFWLYGSTSENYAFDAMFGSLVVLLALRARGMWWLGVGVLLGLSLGMRTTSVFLMAPVAIYILISRYRDRSFAREDLLRAAGGLFAGLLAWLPAVMIAEGGEAAWFAAAAGVSMTAAGPFLGNIVGFLIVTLWALNIAFIYLLVGTVPILRHVRDVYREHLSQAALMVLWVVPALLFFALVIYAKGYLLLVLPGLYIVVAWCILGERVATNKVFDTSLIIAVNVAIFLFMPYLTPPDFVTLRPEIRTPEQRLLSVAGRAFSSYLPSWPRIRAVDEQTYQAVQIVRWAVNDGYDTTAVLVDPSARQFAVSRALQVHLPHVKFVEPSIRNDSMVTFFSGMHWRTRLVPDSLFNAKRLLLLTDYQFVDLYPESVIEPLHRSTNLAIAEIHRGNELAVRRTFEEYFVRR